MNFLRILFFLLCLAGTITASAADGLLHIKEPWRNVFAGETTTFHITTTSLDLSNTTPTWRLSYNNRTLAHGSLHLNKASDRTTAELILTIPTLQEGIMLPADLIVHNDPTSLPLLAEKIYIFSKDPFIQKKEWLTDLRIGLYDPQKTTQAIFETMAIPFQSFFSTDAFSSFNGKLFIVGQNLDLDENPSLWMELQALAKRGIPVLLLAPQKGQVTLSDDTDLAATLERLTLSRENIIQDFDKNLDIHWAPQGQTSVVGLKVTSDDTNMYGLIDVGLKNWPWAQISLKDGGRIIICGFDLLGAWEESPAPRYFLARLIDDLIDPHNQESTK